MKELSKLLLSRNIVFSQENFQARIYLFKNLCEIRLNLTIKTSEWRNDVIWTDLHYVQVFPLSTLNNKIPANIRLSWQPVPENINWKFHCFLSRVPL